MWLSEGCLSYFGKVSVVAFFLNVKCKQQGTVTCVLHISQISIDLTNLQIHEEKVMYQNSAQHNLLKYLRLYMELYRIARLFTQVTDIDPYYPQYTPRKLEAFSKNINALRFD